MGYGECRGGKLPGPYYIYQSDDIENHMVPEAPYACYPAADMQAVLGERGAVLWRQKYAFKLLRRERMAMLAMHAAFESTESARKASGAEVRDVLADASRLNVVALLQHFLHPVYVEED